MAASKAEQRELAKIQAMQQREEERKRRIFDQKQRTMGMDYSALEHQITEKKTKAQVVECTPSSERGFRSASASSISCFERNALSPWRYLIV